MKLFDLRMLFRALNNSLDGIKEAVSNHRAFRQELVMAVIMCPIALWVGNNALEIVILIGVLIFLLIVEIINSAIEIVIDRIGIEKHPLSKKAKDLGSAAVFLSLLNVGFVWGFIVISNFL